MVLKQHNHLYCHHHSLRDSSASQGIIWVQVWVKESAHASWDESLTLQLPEATHADTAECADCNVPQLLAVLTEGNRHLATRFLLLYTMICRQKLCCRVLGRPLPERIWGEHVFAPKRHRQRHMTTHNMKT